MLQRSVHSHTKNLRELADTTVDLAGRLSDHDHCVFAVHEPRVREPLPTDHHAPTILVAHARDLPFGNDQVRILEQDHDPMITDRVVLVFPAGDLAELAQNAQGLRRVLVGSSEQLVELRRDLFFGLLGIDQDVGLHVLLPELLCPELEPSFAQQRAVFLGHELDRATQLVDEQDGIGHVPPPRTQVVEHGDVLAFLVQDLVGLRIPA